MAHKTNTISIDKIDDGKRLDLFLVSQTNVSRTKIQKYIKHDGIEINGEITHVPHRFLLTDDKLEMPTKFDVNYLEDESKIEKNIFGKKKKAKVPKLDILFENNEVLVINKPAGLLVHPTEVSDEPTVMEAAVKYDKRIAKVGDKPKERAGIVHRLDRHASGAMILARTQPAFEYLKTQFQNRDVHKIYRALVQGELEHDEGVIKRRIARNRKNGRMVARPASQDGKEAVTHYRVLRRYANATEIETEIETGRTHQIRVHMHSLGNPVVGDDVYKIKNQKIIKLDRLWLHAYKLTLTLPGDSEPTTFEAPIPEKLTTLTSNLHRL